MYRKLITGARGLPHPATPKEPALISPQPRERLMEASRSDGTAARPVKAASELPSLGICVLSKQEAARYEEYGDTPDCRQHHHVGMKVAEQMVEEFHRWAQRPGDRQCRIVQESLKRWAVIDRFKLPHMAMVRL